MHQEGQCLATKYRKMSRTLVAIDKSVRMLDDHVLISEFGWKQLRAARAKLVVRHNVIDKSK